MWRTRLPKKIYEATYYPSPGSASTGRPLMVVLTRRATSRLSYLPLLFTVFTNSLLDRVDGSSYVSTYVDDLALVFAGRNQEVMAQQLRREVDEVVEWSKMSDSPSTLRNVKPLSSVWRAQSHAGSSSSPLAGCVYHVIRILSVQSVR